MRRRPNILHLLPRSLTSTFHYMRHGLGHAAPFCLQQPPSALPELPVALRGVQPPSTPPSTLPQLEPRPWKGLACG
jgi:hypothetical protein